MDFSNTQVDTDSLPSIDHLDYEGLESNYLTVELLGLGIIAIFPFIGSLFFFFFNELNWPNWMNYLPFLVVILFLIISFTWVNKGFKRKQFALRERDITYRSGLFWRRIIVLPFNRVQHAEVEQGPIERMFDLSQLKIYTAGGSSSDLTISGLTFQRAESIKEFILGKTSSDEEE